MTDKQPGVYEVEQLERQSIRLVRRNDCAYCGRIADLEARLAASERNCDILKGQRDEFIRNAHAKLTQAEREVRILREAIAVAKEQHPYPLDIFLANVTDYERIVPDPQTRTAISGVVGRIGYDACLARIDRHIAEREEGSDE